MIDVGDFFFIFLCFYNFAYIYIYMYVCILQICTKFSSPKYIILTKVALLNIFKILLKSYNKYENSFQKIK